MVSDYSLVPVDYQPDFENVSLVPVDYNPFPDERTNQQAPTQSAQNQPQVQQAQSQPPKTGASQPSAPMPGARTAEPAGSAFTAGTNDFFKSIPRGILSGLAGSASALGRATQAEMGQDIDAPTPEQGMQILEREVTGPMYRPQGRAGQFGASVGEFLGNPASYVAPGSLPLKAGAAVLGGLGSEAGGQLGERTPWEAPFRFAGGALGVLGPLGAARLATEARAVDTAPAAGKTLYHYTNEAGLNGILDEQSLNPSLKTLRPRDVKYGNGQYLTDIPPGTMSSADLSKALVNQIHEAHRFTHYLEINPDGLHVTKGREGVCRPQ